MIPRKTIFPAKSFRDVTCLPMSRKTLVTKENPNNDGDGSFHFCEDYKLFFGSKTTINMVAVISVSFRSIGVTAEYPATSSA